MGNRVHATVSAVADIIRFRPSPALRQTDHISIRSTTENSSPRKRSSCFFRAATLCLCALASTTLQAEEMSVGSAIVASRSGSVTATDASGQSAAAQMHAKLLPRGQTWETASGGNAFLVFSNNVGIGIDSNTQLSCIEFLQRPFEKKDQGFEFEPSISKLRLRLESGQIAIASNRLSPLSDLRIELPNGELRVHKGSCLIRYDSSGLHVTTSKGNVTYYYANSDTREFISAPRGVRISDQSAKRQQVAESFTKESLNAEENRLILAAQHASLRVTFEPNQGNEQAPRPLLIVRPAYFEQAPLRPYQFQD